MSLSERIKAIFRKKNKENREDLLLDDSQDTEMIVQQEEAEAAEAGEEPQTEEEAPQEAGEEPQTDEEAPQEAGEEPQTDEEETQEADTDSEETEDDWEAMELSFDFDVDDPELKEWVLRELEKEAEAEDADETEEMENPKESDDMPEYDGEEEGQETEENEDGEEPEEPEPLKPAYRIQNENEQIIFDLLAHSKNVKEKIQTSDALYDAVAFACRKSKIDIAAPAAEEENSEGYTSIREIAACSHFILRRVRLKKNWYKKNGGVMTGFLKDGQKPVALYYGRLGRYVLYDPEEKTCKRVNAKSARTLCRQAYTFYAAFPNRKMTLKEMFLFGLKRTRWTDRIRYLLFTVTAVLAGLLLPAFQKALFDRLIPMASYDGIVQTGYVVLAFLTGSFFFTISKKLSEFRAAFQMKSALYAAVCERIFHMPQRILRNYKITKLADCVLDTDRLLNAAGKGMNAVFTALLSTVYIVQMYSLSPKLTGQALLFTLLLIVLLVLLAGKLAGRQQQTLHLRDEGKSRKREFFTALKKIKAYGMQERALHECLTAYAQEQKSVMASDRIEQLMNLIARGAGSVAAAFLYWRVIAGNMTFQTGWFIAFMASYGIFLAAMMQLCVSVSELMFLRPLWNRLRPVLETPGEYRGSLLEEDQTGNEEAKLSGELEVAELDFAYEQENQLFHKFSLRVNEGEFIGITGLSGSGKTTLIKLLLGMEKPDSGKIYYGTSDLEQMDLWEFRKKCAIILQEDGLIDGTIRQNICLSNPKATQTQMLAITDRLQLTDEILQLAEGFETKICEDGKILNATQRQKILIARALLKQPELIFFDEATMDMDNESQDLVLEYLRRFSGTRFIVSNRISAIAHCDRILVMDQGRVAESGSYRTLMKRKGLFYKLAIRQLV